MKKEKVKTHLTKEEMSVRINKRTKGAVPKDLVNDVFLVLLETIQEELIALRSVSIENLGTFSPWEYKGGYWLLNNFTDEPVLIQDTMGVKFRPHLYLSETLAAHRSEFLLPDEKK